MIEVTCALIYDHARILSVQKSITSSHPLKWEFPGGKLQVNETAAECVVREIMEELLTEVEVIERLEPVEHDYSGKIIRLIPFVCRIVKGTIVLTEHVDLQWFFPEEWANVEWADADRQLIQKNLDRIKFFSENLT